MDRNSLIYLASGAVLSLAVLFSATAGDAKLYEKQTTIHALACEGGVPPEFALATMEHESGFRNEMIGLRGEIGVSQILPATAVALGFDPARLARDFKYNVKAGVAVMRLLLKESKGDQLTALFNYKAGPNWRNLSPSAKRGVLAYAASIQQIEKKYTGAGCR